MKYRSPGHMRSFDEFREYYRALNPELDCNAADPADALGQPITIDSIGKTLSNRFAIHPMEGWDGTPDGAPTDHTRRRWRNFGRSGAKLIWGGEALAVQRDGRANANQLYLNPDHDSADMLRELRREILDGHAESGHDTSDLCVGLQLTHSGRFARPDGNPAPLCAYNHPVLDARFGKDASVTVLTDAELEAIADNYVAAARAAQDAGFDFVDVKCCHGYLMHEMLSARNRDGRYRGALENRIRLPLEIIGAIRSACPGLGIGVRLSLGDTVPYKPGEDGIGVPEWIQDDGAYSAGFGVDANNPRAFDLEEPFAFLRELIDHGVALFNITLGSPYYCPHIQRPAAYPPSDGYLPPEDPLLGAQRHLQAVRACKAAFPDATFVGTGYSYLQEWLPAIAAHEVSGGHADFVGIGRMILSYPELPTDVLAGNPMTKKKICRTFSDCTTAPRNGMISGCFPLDPYYKSMDIAARLKAIKRDTA